MFGVYRRQDVVDIERDDRSTGQPRQDLRRVQRTCQNTSTYQ